MTEPVVVRPGEVTRGHGESHIPPASYGRTPEGAVLHGPLVVDRKPRCPNCGRFLAFVSARPWRIKCSRCGKITGAEPTDAWPFGGG